MARVNWAGLLNLQGLAGRWRSAMGEGATAVEDRMELARLEWADHKRRLALLALLLVVFGVLAVVALLLLSAAVLVQFWDTEHRVMVAWLLFGGWLALLAIALWQLLAAVRRLARPFILTRNELSQDWQALKKRL